MKNKITININDAEYIFNEKTRDEALKCAHDHSKLEAFIGVKLLRGLESPNELYGALMSAMLILREASDNKNKNSEKDEYNILEILDKLSYYHGANNL